MKHLLPVQVAHDLLMLYGIQTGTQKLIELFDEPCWKMKLNDEDFGRLKGLDYSNQDGIINWVCI